MSNWHRTMCRPAAKGKTIMNRLEERRLRRIIEETATNAIKSVKNVGRLTEKAKPEKELTQWMKTPLSSLGANPTKSLSGPAKSLVKKGLADGAEDDDTKITGDADGAGTPVPVTKLLASQNEVGMKQSLKNVCTGVNGMGWDGIDYGDVEWLISAMKPNATITFKSALLGAKTSDGNVVLDGHHRWSQAFMINPTASVNVVFLSAGDLSADETLKAVHLAILGKTGGSKTKSASGGNLFSASEGDVKKYFDSPVAKIDPKTGKKSDAGVAPYVYAVMKLEGIDDPAEGEKAAIGRVMDAISKCASTVVGGAPSRDAMPQADGETNPITASDVAKALNAGEINYQPPFKSGGRSVKKSKDEDTQQETIYRTDGQIIVERWQRLAGLIK